jgi:hypothetical protein
MIKDLDLTLKSLLTGEADPGSELSQANLSFAVPDEDWQKKGNKLDLNVYLYDIRENRELRTNERQVERNPDGRVVQWLPPPRIDCSYIITAWNKATSGAEDNELQEHRLLSQVLMVLLKNPFIPADYLQGLLVGQQPRMPMISAQPGRLTEPVEFWNTLNTPVRPSVHCIVTLSLDLDESIEGRMIISAVTEYEQFDSPGARRKVVRVGGRITDSEDPPNGIDAAVVTIVELQKQTVTDSNGYYTFAQLSPGEYTFSAAASGFTPGQITRQAPIPDGESYDIQLSQ